MKIKIMFMLAALVVMGLAVAFAPVQPIKNVEAQNSNSKNKGNDKSNRLKKADKVVLSSAKGSSADDKNITGMRGKNSLTNKPTQTKSRGTGQKTCYIDFDNNTDYVIDIFVDGKLLVSPDIARKFSNKEVVGRGGDPALESLFAQASTNLTRSEQIEIPFSSWGTTKLEIEVTQKQP